MTFAFGRTYISPYNRHRQYGGDRHDWPVVAHVYSEHDLAIYMGCIKYSFQRRIMSAHCAWERPGDPPTIGDCGTHGICRCDRNCKTDDMGEVEHRGRPLGFLAAWLQIGCDSDSRSDHLSASKCVSRARRIRARNHIARNSVLFSEALAL